MNVIKIPVAALQKLTVSVERLRPDVPPKNMRDLDEFLAMCAGIKPEPLEAPETEE